MWQRWGGGEITIAFFSSLLTFLFLSLENHIGHAKL
jgi:hypothetical protein